MASIAVLMTCHNRRKVTLRCLESLRPQPGFEETNLFLVDDGSSDGTGEAVLAAMPAAHVIDGSGSLFWNGGMRLAWQRAMSVGPFDYYLWLNDDVILEPGSLSALVADAALVAPDRGEVIVVGATTDPESGAITYGGHLRPVASRPLRLKLVEPTGAPRKVDTLSGNVVLISAAAERRLGNIGPQFEHIYGDLDYGFRAQVADVPVYLASVAAGRCERAVTKGGSLEAGTPFVERLRRRLREERKIHARDWRRIVRMHSGLGPFSFVYSITPYLRLLTRR